MCASIFVYVYTLVPSGFVKDLVTKNDSEF